SAGMMTKFIAVSRSAFGNVRTMVRRPTGIIIAAPMPCRTRVATSIGALSASPHRTDETVKIATAAENTRRVPQRSAIQPLARIQTGRLTTYLATTDFKLSGVTCRLSAIVGTAVLMIVESSCSMKSAEATTHGRYRLTVAVSMGAGEAGMVEASPK